MSPEAKAAHDAWLESIGPKNADGLTSHELAVAWGVGKDTAHGRIRVLIDAKRMICVGRKPITRIDGKKDSAPVYKLVKPKKRRR